MDGSVTDEIVTWLVRGSEETNANCHVTALQKVKPGAANGGREAPGVVELSCDGYLDSSSDHYG